MFLILSPSVLLRMMNVTRVTGTLREDRYMFLILSPSVLLRMMNVTRVTGTLREDRYMFLILSPSVLLRMINVADRVVQKVKTHAVCMFSKDTRCMYVQ